MEMMAEEDEDRQNKIAAMIRATPGPVAAPPSEAAVAAPPSEAELIAMLE